jgi:hypothetical protein
MYRFQETILQHSGRLKHQRNPECKQSTPNRVNRLGLGFELLGCGVLLLLCSILEELELWTRFGGVAL